MPGYAGCVGGGSGVGGGDAAEAGETFPGMPPPKPGEGGWWGRLTGPPRQATGPPRLGAGVGVGMIRGIQKFNRKVR